MGGLSQIFWERGRDFQELSYHPLFGLIWLAWEPSWHWWVCHLAIVLQWAYYKAWGQLEVQPSTLSDLVDSNQFLSCPMALSGEGNGTPHQYSCLENPMDGGAWWAAVHGVVKSQTQLSNFTFIFHFHALEKEMATHSSVLAWRIPGTGEPGGLPSMGSHRVGHNWSNLAAAAAWLCHCYKGCACPLPSCFTGTLPNLALWTSSSDSSFISF